MNRTIKVRAWDILEKKFVTNFFNGSMPKLMINLKGELGWIDDSFDGISIKYVIQQYTGLNDKNGKEIYEGDIVKLIDNSVGDIQYEDSSASYIFSGFLESEESYDKASLSYVGITRAEVIGNIFENKFGV